MPVLHRHAHRQSRFGSFCSASSTRHHYLLDLCAAGEARMPLAVAPPVSEGGHGSDEPQESAGKDDPYRVLHPLDVAVSLGIFVNVHL